MKAYVKRRLTQAGVIEGPVPPEPPKLPRPSSPMPSPMYITDPFQRQCLLQLNEGKTMTLHEIGESLKLKKDKVRRLFAHRPGVFKIGRDYRVPQIVFDRMMVEMMQGRSL
jgi:hypothetical protein